MIRVFTMRSSAAAKNYYGSALSREDYYSEAQEIVGKWYGSGAEALGLKGEVQQEHFERLCDNRHPLTDDQLTPRTDANRIVGFDISFHAPKSLSVVHAITADPRLSEAFRLSAAETMVEIEAQTETRVRLNGAYEDRVTGNLAWAEFVHLTARPVDGMPDPHLHVHQVCFNVTLDSAENRWKAAKIREARQDMPMHQAAFHARLAKRVSELGYAISRTQKGWEISGLHTDVMERFSRRSEVIETEAKRRGLTEDKDKDGLAALTAESKRKGLSYGELRQYWKTRLSREELQKIRELPFSRAGQTVTPKQAVDHALDKQFARDSVVRLNRVLAEAMRFGVGTVTPNQIREELNQRPLVVKRIESQTLCTTQEILAEEIALIATVREGKGRCRPLIPKEYHLRRHFLSDEQQNATRQLLNSQDRILALRGGAGTGKTTTMQEVVEAIQLGGQEVYAFAPSASASRETLREAGFREANTVAHYLSNQKLQEKSRGKVIWIDEAGLLGTREMWQVFEAAGPNTRIILTGDHRQHAPVSRGDPFRVMQEFAGLKPAEIAEVRRQRPEAYKSAVVALSKGRVKEGFMELDRMGAIQEIPNEAERYRTLANDYKRLSSPKQRPLVVSPTHSESRKVTTAIRNELRNSGKLGIEAHSFTRYQNLQLEVAERKEPENYREGMLIQYHQNGKGVIRGERFTVNQITTEGKVFIQDSENQTRRLRLQEAKKFQVFEPQSIELAKGDLIRITRNGTSLDGRRQSNGQVRQINSFTKEGHLKLNTGAVISSKDGHFDYGYCQTSHTAQSKSKRDVLVAQSAESFAASSREQFYVSVSRGKERIHLYTDQKTELLEAVKASPKKLSGLEMAEIHPSEIDRIMQKELNSQSWQRALNQRRGVSEITPATMKLLEERQSVSRDKGAMTNWKTHVKKAGKTTGMHRKNQSWQTYIRKERAILNSPKLKLQEAGTEAAKPENSSKPKIGVDTPKKRGIGSRLLGRLGGDRYYTKTISGGHQIKVKTVKNRRQNGDPVEPSLKEKIAAKTKGLKERFGTALVRKTRGKTGYQSNVVAEHKARTNSARAAEKPVKKTVQPPKPKIVAKAK